MIGHVVLAVRRRFIVLIGVDSEHTEVASLTRPHPVIGLSAKLSHRLWDGEHQAHVGEIAIGGGIILVAFVERINVYIECRVLLSCRFCVGILQRVEHTCL